MTTLIKYRTPEGKARRCDARCHNARKPHCECICRGVNHGVGHNQAVKNTLYALERYMRKQGVDVPITTKEERENPIGGIDIYPLFAKR